MDFEHESCSKTGLCNLQPKTKKCPIFVFNFIATVAHEIHKMNKGMERKKSSVLHSIDEWPDFPMKFS